MIELYSKRFLLPMSDASRVPVDLGALAADLDRAQREAGIQESWLTDHVLAALCQLDFTIGEAVSGGVSSEDVGGETERMILRMLVDSGFPDVAERFAEIRRIELMVPEPANRRPWSQLRIRQVVVQHIGTSEATASRLAEGIVARLQALGFRSVGDALIVEVARHILSEWSDRAPVERAERADGWLMPPGFWETFLPGPAAELVELRALVIRPISRLMPVIRMEFQVARFIEGKGLPPFAELAFLPALRTACRALVEALVQVREQVGTTYGADIAKHPAHVTFTGLEEWIANLANSRSDAAARFREVRDLISSELSVPRAGTVLLRFAGA